LLVHILFIYNVGAELRSVCTEAGMYAIRSRRKAVTEKDFLDAINKVGGWLHFIYIKNISSMYSTKT